MVVFCSMFNRLFIFCCTFFVVFFFSGNMMQFTTCLHNFTRAFMNRVAVTEQADQWDVNELISYTNAQTWNTVPKYAFKNLLEEVFHKIYIAIYVDTINNTAPNEKQFEQQLAVPAYPRPSLNFRVWLNQKCIKSVCIQRYHKHTKKR